MRREGGDLILPAPRALSEVLGGAGGRPMPERGDNLGLWLDKFLPVAERTWALKEGDRLRAFEAFTREKHRSAAAEAALVRLEGAARAYFGEECVASIRVRTEGRLLVDYGRPSPIESNLSLHFLYGAPRIPGSALKGVLRAALRPFEKEVPESLKPWRPGAVLAALGEQKRRGELVIFDALPEEGRFELATDVLTPHFGPYYRDETGATPPADWHSPVPHTFLSVVNTTFRCVLALDAEQRELLAPASECLLAALTQFGVGAKTRAGYGRLCAV